MKKCISLLLAVVTFLTTFISNSTLTIHADEMSKVGLYLKKDVQDGVLLSFDGATKESDFNPGFVVYKKDGKEYPAYCIEPNVHGIKGAGEYSVDISAVYSNKQAYGAILNGYPFKKLDRLTEYESYYATQIAVWTIVHDYYGTDNIGKWKPYPDLNDTRVYDAMMKIRQAGLNTTSIPKSGGTIVATPNKPKADTDDIDDKYFSQNFSVSPSVAYTVTLPSNAPAGAKITDMNNIGKSNFTAGEKFKVIFPKTGGEQNVSFSVNLSSTESTDGMVVMYGDSGDESLQKYAVIAEGIGSGGTAVVNFSEETKVPDEPDTPPSELIIKKVEYGSTKGLAGAVFSVTDADGGIVGDFITDNSGQVTITLDDLGAYYVDEIVAPDGFLIDENSHKDIVISATEENILTFANKKSTEITINKVDADTGEKLNGAVIRLAYDGGHEFQDVTINGGSATVSGLKPGTYTVKEIVSPSGYILDSTPHSIKLEAGKTAEITLKNSHKPGLIIRKYDEDTGLPLEGAEFSVARKGGQIVFEGITPKNGEIFIEGLTPDWYVVTELAAPHGYLKSAESKTVELEAGKVLEIKFDNRLRPALQILKIDSDTKKPLAGAKFHVRKTESDTTSEYVTDANGIITINNLDEAIYTVTEIQAPSGYMIDESHKDIQLEWGKTKSLIFTNTKKPILEIHKVDAITGKSVSGVKFRVTKTEDKTVSEYTTDETGIIRIENLDEAVYTVEEISVPENYIFDTQHKEVALGGGKVKTLIYENTRKPTLIITKLSATTKKPIPNTYYKIQHEDKNGGVVTLGTYPTNKDGQVVIPNVGVGWYVATEVKAAQGYSLSSNPVTRFYLSAGTNSYIAENIGTGTETNDDLESEVKYTSNEVVAQSGSAFITTVAGEIIENYPLNSIVIKKTDAVTGELLAGATFELRQVSEDISGNSGTIIGTYTTDNSGAIVITGLDAGAYIIEEVEAPKNYLLSENNSQQAWLKADGTSIVETRFANYPYGSLLITKIDGSTNKPLANAKFRVLNGKGEVAGNTNGEYLTNENGEILISNLKPDSYVITEIEAPTGFTVDTTPQTIQIGTDGKTYKVSFKNYPDGTLIIRKLDSVTNEPLAGAEFLVKDSTGAVVGTSNGIYVTDKTGTIQITGLIKGSYVVQEIKAPTGYILENQSQTITVNYAKTYTLTFYNKPMSSLQIIKIDADTKAPLKGAKFKVYKANGEILGEYTTDGDGLIIISELEAGWYKAVEVKAPTGYVIDDTAQDFEAKHNQFIKLTFENKKMTSLIIKKIDEITGEPLSGAKFKVEKQNGEHVGEYTTDKDGLINIPTLDPDWYIVREMQSPSGYILDESPKTVEVKTNTPTVVTFSNKPMQGLTIKKISSSDRQPIKGAEFKITEMDGGLIGNYKTDNSGIITVPELEPGFYIVSEVKAADGYFMDAEPQIFEIKWGEPLVIEIENTPISGIVVLKTDSQTRKPLAGVKFMVERWDGYRIGIFKTNAQGRIYLDDLPVDDYIIYEIEALDGYELDPTAYEVRVRPGKQEVIEIQNTPLAGLRILKIDSVSKKPIFNVEFMVFDENGKVVGTYYTNNNGVIDFAGILPSGRYTIRETRPAAGYYADDVPKTIEFESGVMTEIVWENTPSLGQIQIYKTSADDNEMTGLSAGTPLSEAVFEVYEYKSGNIVDRFVSGGNGMAVSSPLPLGRYIVKEVKAPQYYKLSEKQLDITIEFATQIIKEEFKNYSVNLGVSIKKTGNYECMSGDTIAYTIKNVRNESTVALNNFYWRDVVPTDAARLTKIVTGTYNKSVKYKVQVKTNKGNEMIIADNLKTSKNNVIDCSNTALGLGNDEYVTSFYVIFGNVPAGFAQVEKAQVYLTVKKNLPNNYQFANKADVGGTYNGEWQISNSVWTTKVYAKPQPLPNTGY